MNLIVTRNQTTPTPAVVILDPGGGPALFNPSTKVWDVPAKWPLDPAARKIYAIPLVPNIPEPGWWFLCLPIGPGPFRSNQFLGYFYPVADGSIGAPYGEPPAWLDPLYDDTYKVGSVTIYGPATVTVGG